LFETYLNIIQEEVFRCKSITTSILSFVQKTTYEKKDMNVNEMLDKTIEIIGFQGRLKNIEVRKHYAEQPLIIRGSEGELRQVFIAIITNALDAMEEKGALTLDTGAEGGRVVIRIRDTGPGIPADLIPKIFDPFFTTKSDKGGTGLGLSIARKIVLNYGGDIDAFSDPGKGTIFTITFPK
jgi:two-component system NtrC family sensor kinase